MFKMSEAKKTEAKKKQIEGHRATTIDEIHRTDSDPRTPSGSARAISHHSTGVATPLTSIAGKSAEPASDMQVIRRKYVSNINSTRRINPIEFQLQNLEILAPIGKKEMVTAKLIIDNMRLLYRPENIIGYTQVDAGTLPTIYYKYAGLHGHLTQNHQDAENIGFALPLASRNYIFENRRHGDGDIKLYEEYSEAKLQHRSRSAFISISNISDEKFFELVLAGEKKHRLKSRYTGRYSFSALRQMSGAK
ncbi:hypothetical protein [Burkholderia ambifaria]|uniref:Uncharacterized protein n=1 Tax=Burkholderia ambifaria MEX-5 TaxID=396597 RepID=B1TG83_9BURK|nr:hypothetical protein [Burkholderia ambifaria]EDT37421.1 hypothetical protein BamMEX5DRAFT_6799 [Burkholderia ambifaria MEX-5]